nr:craniofacial development protein 2-like [Tanacetum cinerariifolium]
MGCLPESLSIAHPRSKQIETPSATLEINTSIESPLSFFHRILGTTLPTLMHWSLLNKVSSARNLCWEEHASPGKTLQSLHALSKSRIKALSDGNLRSCLSQPGGVGENREARRGSRVEAKRKIRVGSWIETKWKGSSTIEGNGYKLWYSGFHTARNRVVVILKASLKNKVVHVNQCSDKIISLTLVIEGETVNVISAGVIEWAYISDDKVILSDATLHSPEVAVKTGWTSSKNVNKSLKLSVVVAVLGSSSSVPAYGV